MMTKQDKQGEGKKLELKNVTKSFNGRMVVNMPSLKLGEHKIEGLIGPNGAGKTTLLSLITGKLLLDQGQVNFFPNGTAVDISKHNLDQIARMGLIRTNQIIQDFDSLSIKDSLLLSFAGRSHESFWKLFNERQLIKEAEADIEKYLDYFEFENPEGHAMSAGEKKLLDIIRCLMLKPKFLLMDEPTAGLPDDQTKLVMKLMQQKTEEEGMSVLIIEHDLDLIWEMSEFVHFMAEGQLVAQGTPEEIRQNQTVAEKYMGASNV